MSSKVEKEIHFESSLERDFIILQEFNDEVISFLEQPFVIELEEKSSYTPDFIIEYFHKPPEVIEIKYSNDPKLLNPAYLSKLSKAKDFLEKKGINFSIYTEHDIRVLNGEYLRNLKKLLTFRHAFETKNLVQSQLRHIKHKMTTLIEEVEEDHTTIQNVLEKHKKIEDYEGELLFYIWYLIANRFISCDLHEEITYSSKLWKD